MSPSNQVLFLENPILCCIIVLVFCLCCLNFIYFCDLCENRNIFGHIYSEVYKILQTLKHCIKYFSQSVDLFIESLCSLV